jgi:hypothetical protein
MWGGQQDKLLMQFSIHAMGKLAPDFIKTILAIDEAGFDCDYISERLLMGVTYKDGMLETAAGTRYKGLIIPGSLQLPESVVQHICQLTTQGAPVFYNVNGSYAKDSEPLKTAGGRGFENWNIKDAGLQTVAKPETMKTQYGLKAIRRKNDKGYHYFIANLTPNDINENIKLAVPFKDAMWFDPLTGNRYRASINGDEIDLTLHSGQSMILETFDDETLVPADLPVLTDTTNMIQFIPVKGPWTLSFTEEAPKVTKTFQLDELQTWETLDDDSVRVTMGTGVYTTHVKLTKDDLKDVTNWQIELGDVRESARVYINGQFIGCAWSVPFVLDCQQTLKAGDNELRIEVTNLPANRIADLDRRGVKWRKMEEINVVDINYKKTTYDQWEPMPSGLNSAVKLVRRWSSTK